MRRNDAVTEEEGAKNHAVRFVAVTDSRKRKIRGLWRRGDRYYAQMRMEVDGGQSKPKRIALNGKIDFITGPDGTQFNVRLPFEAP